MGVGGGAPVGDRGQQGIVRPLLRILRPDLDPLELQPVPRHRRVGQRLVGPTDTDLSFAPHGGQHGRCGQQGGKSGKAVPPGVVRPEIVLIIKGVVFQVRGNLIWGVVAGVVAHVLDNERGQPGHARRGIARSGQLVDGSDQVRLGFHAVIGGGAASAVAFDYGGIGQVGGADGQHARVVTLRRIVNAAGSRVMIQGVGYAQERLQLNPLRLVARNVLYAQAITKEELFGDVS